MENNFVPPCGSLSSSIMIIGEAPGKDELILQKPFVGRCGKLLDKMLEKAGISRDKCYITNTVKTACRDGNKNRPPTDEEIESNIGCLFEEIKESKAKVILCLGKVPTRALLGLKKTFKLSDYVGKIYQREYTKAHIIPLFHTSYLLQYGSKLTEEAQTLLIKIGKKYYESK